MPESNGPYDLHEEWNGKTITIPANLLSGKTYAQVKQKFLEVFQKRAEEQATLAIKYAEKFGAPLERKEKLNLAQQIAQINVGTSEMIGAMEDPELLPHLLFYGCPGQFEDLNEAERFVVDVNLAHFFLRLVQAQAVKNLIASSRQDGDETNQTETTEPTE